MPETLLTCLPGGFLSAGNVPRKWVLVEDASAYGFLLTLLFRQETAFEPRLYPHGLDLLKDLSALKELHPICFLLDYRLPHLNGLDLARQLRVHSWLQHVPIVSLTACEEPDLPKKAAQYGVGFLAKPFDIWKLLHAVEQIIETAFHRSKRDEPDTASPA